MNNDNLLHNNPLNINNMFETLQNNILNSMTPTEFINSYNIYYINYWFYINNNTTIDDNIIKQYNALHENFEFVKFILLHLSNKKIKEISKLVCPYITFHKKINDALINNYIELIKNNLILRVNNDYETIINIFFHRKLATHEYKTFNKFYIKTFLHSTTKYESFINYLPSASDISKFSNDGVLTNIEPINIIKVLQKLFKYFNVNYKIKSHNNNLKIYSSASNEIHIIFNNFNSILYSSINTIKINNTSTKNIININLKTNTITNLSQLLSSIHLLTVGIKTIDSEPTNIYEFENLLDYDNYYKDSFKIFFLIIKPHINVDMNYNKFIIELFKYYYLYAIVDYYFYVIPDVIDLIIKDIKNKFNILNIFFNDLKQEFKLPDSMYPYPPFIPNQQYDIDNIIYYCYDHPNYFKLYDFINALFEVMNIKNIDNYDEQILQCIKNTKITNNITTKINKVKPTINKIDDEYYELTASQL
jgi:hypothetical protein